MWNMQSFVDIVKEKFKMYFLAYGVEKIKNKTVIHLVIDDLDVKRMAKKDLVRMLDSIINSILLELLARAKSKENMKAKIHLISDLNQNSIWQVLGDSAMIINVKTVARFLQLNLPEGFFDAYDTLPVEFKLEDLKKKFEYLWKRAYHRNTYQNWLKGLQKAKLIKLTGKRYKKILRERQIGQQDLSSIKTKKDFAKFDS